MGAIQQVLSSYLSVPPLPAGATARWNVLSNSAGLLATLEDVIGTNDGTASGSARGTVLTGASGLNGRNVLRLDGVANGYSLSAAIVLERFTVLSVMRRIGTNAISIGGSDFYPAVFAQSGLISFGNNRMVTSTGGYAVTSTGVDTNWKIIGTAWDSGDAQRPYRVNGSAVTPAALANYGNATGIQFIGKSGGIFASCDLADIVVWGHALSDPEILAATSHLNSIWGGVY